MIYDNNDLAPNPYSPDIVTGYEPEKKVESKETFVQNRKERRAEEKRSRRMDSELRNGAIRQNDSKQRQLRATGIKKRLEARVTKK